MAPQVKVIMDLTGTSNGLKADSIPSSRVKILNCLKINLISFKTELINPSRRDKTLKIFLNHTQQD